MRRPTLRKTALPILLCLALAGCFKSSEERAADHYESGLALLEQGDPDRAMVEFRNTLKYAEGNLDARRQMAAIHLGRGSKKQAYRNYLAVVEQLPQDVEGRTTLSELAFDLGDWREFERHATQALDLIPADAPDTLKTRTTILDMALRFRQAIADEAEDEQSAILTAAAQQQTTAPDNAILRRILINGYVQEARYDDALTQLDQAIEAEPNVLENYGARLELLGRQGDAAAVEAELQRMVSRFPNDENVKTTYLRYLTSRGKTDEAETFLRAEVENTPAESRIDTFASLIAFILRTRGPEAALEEVNTALAATPDDAVRLMRASLQFDNGNREEAMAEMEEIISAEDSKLSPLKKQEAKVTLAQMLANTGNEVGARQRVEEVLAEDPNSAGALKLKAVWQIEEDNTEAAINGLRTALSANPKDADAMDLMAQAYERAGNTNLRLDFLSQAVEATNNAPLPSLRYARTLAENDNDLQAESVLIASLRIAPGNIDVLTLLGQVYIRMDDAGRTRQVIRTLQNIKSDQAQSNATALNLELVAKEQGNDEALKLLEQLATSAGAQAGDQVKLSVIRGRLNAGDQTGALSYAQDLVAEEPDNRQFRYALALTHLALRDFEAAETELRTIVSAAPSTVEAWLQLARIQSVNDNHDAALATIEEGLQAAPGAPDLLWGKASLLQRDGNIDGAIEIFETLYEDNSNSLIVANNLASLLSTYRSDAASLERAERIARRLGDTNLPAFQDTYGWIKHLNGDSAEAVAYLEPAAAGLPRDVSVQVHLGMVYAAVNRADDAIAQLRRALEVGGPLAGNEALLEQARAKIAELEAAPAAQEGADQN